ncbi:DUF134 domain-containing protein [Ruminococcus sp. Marseille-P6503]|uniref:DUF134 domain-containing protein n=1 Tax=Ruminococcus sp. Marseille-P6503 TaxID=2364796 RepID=UPI000F52EC6E|nr:DUF134 domain-containing protein [Ruminococcus sp. Marseille-P6503]
MPRPQKCRHICSKPVICRFEPVGNGAGKSVVIGYDEYEAVRLLDYESLSQEECALRMRVSRPTVTRMYESARKKLADALVNGKSIVIDGGDVTVCPKLRPECRIKSCCHRGKL